jgi:hypothetical protein
VVVVVVVVLNSIKAEAMKARNLKRIPIQEIRQTPAAAGTTGSKVCKQRLQSAEWSHKHRNTMTKQASWQGRQVLLLQAAGYSSTLPSMPNACRLKEGCQWRHEQVWMCQNQAVTSLNS